MINQSYKYKLDFHDTKNFVQHISNYDNFSVLANEIQNLFNIVKMVQQNYYRRHISIKVTSCISINF